ncbi:MAG: citrate/2-methylcitrate synthase, partial [Planctomycetota bacterium]
MSSQEDPTLFEIRKSHLNTGLRGLPVGTCLTSAVDKDRGVSYCGYAIDELAGLSSEAVIHLLLEKRLPDADEEAAFAAELRRRGALPDCVLEMLARLPKRAHPMEWFVAGILYLGMTDKSGDVREDGLNLIARVSGVAAAVFRLREGWGEPIAPNANLSYGENFAHMLGAPGASAQLGALLQIFHVLHMDHGGGNLSTFTGKAVASGHADVYVSMAAAMAALYGPLHGRANQECLEFVREVKSSDPAKVETFVR